MTSILFAWELGGGYGHLVPIATLAQSLVERGHSVKAIVRDVHRATSVFADIDLQFVQAPVKLHYGEPPFPIATTFAQVLRNTAIDKVGPCRARTKSWLRLIASFDPDLIICDHSPTALLASRCLGLSSASLGIGFSCPAQESPLRNLRSWVAFDEQRAVEDEEQTLRVANEVLTSLGASSLDRLCDLYPMPANTLLCTFSEFDPYVPRQEACYLGPWNRDGRLTVEWPQLKHANIFVYLNWSSGAAKLLAALAKKRCNVLAFIPGTPEEQLKKCCSDGVQVFREPIALSRLLSECDLVICHGNLVTSSQALLSATPALLLPNILEHRLNAECIERLGAGLIAAPDVSKCELQIDELLEGGPYLDRAREFAHKHRDHSQQAQVELATDQIERILGQR